VRLPRCATAPRVRVGDDREPRRARGAAQRPGPGRRARRGGPAHPARRPALQSGRELALRGRRTPVPPGGAFLPACARSPSRRRAA
jgi:hypothetical protein